jgi:hypothetical protein
MLPIAARNHALHDSNFLIRQRHRQFSGCETGQFYTGRFAQPRVVGTRREREAA